MAAKTPQDRRKKREPFEFNIDGKIYTMRPPTFGQALILTGSDDEASAALEMMADCTSPEAWEAIKSLDSVDASDLFKDWMAAVGGGESGNSDGSSA